MSGVREVATSIKFSVIRRFISPPIDSNQSGREALRPIPFRNSMKLAYFDCFSGISGDMTLGALVDAGCSLELLRSGLRGLQVPGWTIAAEKVWKNGMSATFVRMTTEDQTKHRSLSAILQILEKSNLSESVRTNASAIFRKLG